MQPHHPCKIRNSRDYFLNLNLNFLESVTHPIYTSTRKCAASCMHMQDWWRSYLSMYVHPTSVMILLPVQNT